MPGSNNIAIEQLVLFINGSDVTQTTEATGVNVNSDTAVNVKSVRITDGAQVDLTFFNTAGAEARNINPELATISGIGVFDNGTYTPSTSGLAAYGNAYAAASQDTDLRNHGYHDFLTPTNPTAGTPDLDLLFFRALNLDDYVLVAERWGNSFFEVTALDADGNPYAGANVLRIGGPGPSADVGYTNHDWNTGYAAATNQPTQAQALTLFSVEKFFEGTQVSGPVYGFRIDNDGEADVKLMGISANTFLDNPENPQLIPEPSAFLMTAIAGLALVLPRRRNRC